MDARAKRNTYRCWHVSICFYLCFNIGPLVKSPLLLFLSHEFVTLKKSKKWALHQQMDTQTKIKTYGVMSISICVSLSFSIHLLVKSLFFLLYSHEFVTLKKSKKLDLHQEIDSKGERNTYRCWHGAICFYHYLNIGPLVKSPLFTFLSHEFVTKYESKVGFIPEDRY
jgi:hypothetical protein